MLSTARARAAALVAWLAMARKAIDRTPGASWIPRRGRALASGIAACLALGLSLLAPTAAATHGNAPLTAIPVAQVSPLSPDPSGNYYVGGTWSVTVPACTPHMDPFYGSVHDCYIGVEAMITWPGVGGTLGATAGDWNSGVSISGTIPCTLGVDYCNIIGSGVPRPPPDGVAFEVRVIHHGAYQPYLAPVRFPLCFTDIPASCTPTSPSGDGGTAPPVGPGPGPAQVPGPNAPLCNPARGVRPPGCRNLGITDQRLLDQLARLGWEVLDLLILDDLRRLRDPNVSYAEKALIIASYVIPQGKAARIAAKAAKAIVKKAGPPFVSALRKGAREIAQDCPGAATATSPAFAAASCRRVRAALEADIRKSLRKKVMQDEITKQVLDSLPLKKKKDSDWVYNVEVANPVAKAKQVYNDLTAALGKKKVVGGEGEGKGKGSPGVYRTVPGNQLHILRTKTGKKQKVGPKRVGPPAVEIHGPNGERIKKIHFVKKKS